MQLCLCSMNFMIYSMLRLYCILFCMNDRHYIFDNKILGSVNAVIFLTTRYNDHVIHKGVYKYSINISL